MIEFILFVVIGAFLGLVYLMVRILTNKPTHADHLEERRSVALTAQLNQANKLLVKLKIIDEVMPCLPAEFKSELQTYLGGISK